MSLTDRPKVAGVEVWELRSALENITFRHKDSLEPAGLVGAAVIYRFLAGCANGLYRDAVITMRKEGISWEELAAQLGVKSKDDPEDPWSAGYELFKQLASEDSWGSPYVGYRCAKCDLFVQDRGPLAEMHPEDIYEGHAADCPVLVAVVIAWQRRRAEVFGED